MPNKSKGSVPARAEKATKIVKVEVSARDIAMVSLTEAAELLGCGRTTLWDGLHNPVHRFYALAPFVRNLGTDLKPSWRVSLGDLRAFQKACPAMRAS